MIDEIGNRKEEKNKLIEENNIRGESLNKLKHFIKTQSCTKCKEMFQQK